MFKSVYILSVEKQQRRSSSFDQILRIKAVHFLAFFILVYVGVEVTIGGMVIHRSSSQGLFCRIKIVTFMLDLRDGGTFCRLHLVRFLESVCLIRWAANGTHT